MKTLMSLDLLHILCGQTNGEKTLAQAQLSLLTAAAVVAAAAAAVCSKEGNGTHGIHVAGIDTGFGTHHNGPNRMPPETEKAPPLSSGGLMPARQLLRRGWVCKPADAKDDQLGLRIASGWSRTPL